MDVGATAEHERRKLEAVEDAGVGAGWVGELDLFEGDACAAYGCFLALSGSGFDVPGRCEACGELLRRAEFEDIEEATSG